MAERAADGDAAAAVHHAANTTARDSADSAASPLLHANPDWGQWDGGKVGGKPVWLNPLTVPAPAQLACAECSHALAFLVQIYCPLDDAPDAFHRSLFVFVCRQPGCARQGNGRVFRSQLPQRNALYPDESGVAQFAPATPLPAAHETFCALCNERAVFTCSACHVARYCSKAHQKDHWSAGGHKHDCARCLETNRLVETQSFVDSMRAKGSKWLFPEYELVIDHEPDSREAANDERPGLTRCVVATADKTQQTGSESDVFTDDSEIDVTQRELNDAIGASQNQDKLYIRFLTRVELAKDQVLRYSRWHDSNVLWVHAKDTLAGAGAPACPRCGGARRFEFQVLPQLLFYLHVDDTSSLSDITSRSCDWGTLAVYTCETSCPLDGEHVEEFLHYQSPYAGLLNTIGAAKPSKNVQFDFAYTGFERTQSGITELEAALRNYAICLKGYHMSAQTLVAVIEKVGGDVENSDEMRAFAGGIKSGFVQLDGHLLNDSVKRFEQRVLAPTTGWLSRAQALKQQIGAFNEEKLLYDHYTRKVMALREARDKRATAGKAEKPKEVEKLVRNEQKYAAITNSYSKTSDQTVAHLRDFVNCREDTLTPILQRMLEFRVKYAMQAHEESQKLQPLIKNESKYDSIMGQLESFVGRHPGGAASPRLPQEPAKTPLEPEAPVHSFSFASFVGDAPSPTPSEASQRVASLKVRTADPDPIRPPPLASPSSPDGFYFDDYAQSSPAISPVAAAPMAFGFQLPPPPPFALAAPTPEPPDKWSSFPSKASAPPLPAANFATTPAADASSFATPLAAPAQSGAADVSWGAFDDLTPPAPSAPTGNPFQFHTNFAQLHQAALGGDDATRSGPAYYMQ
ncbi:hypothetical protein PybrP1_002539 [[Pythium] brassicae (nom. inval.)]|nr:hypothetical protein PybrP1_002539 [[Pythium] brassicae (nom. inval.)]